MLEDGFHDVPAGKIAAIVTSLQMFEEPSFRPEADGADWTLERLTSPTAEEYLALYSAVGRDWLWFTRLVMPRQDLLAAIQDPRVEVWRLAAPGSETGILELDFREPGACELAYFGVSAGLVGGGAARWLMNRAVERAWSQPIQRFWVHTCTLDHPSAVGFYTRSGFTAFELMIEVADDPRLTGHLPAGASPQVPTIRPPAREE